MKLHTEEQFHKSKIFLSLASTLLLLSVSNLSAQIFSDWIKDSKNDSGLTIITENFANKWSTENNIAIAARGGVRPAVLNKDQQSKFNEFVDLADKQSLAIHWILYNARTKEEDRRSYLEIWVPYALWENSKGKNLKFGSRPADEFEKKRYLDEVEKAVTELKFELPDRARVAFVCKLTGSYDFQKKSVSITISNQNIYTVGDASRGDYKTVVDTARASKSLLETIRPTSTYTVSLEKEAKIIHFASLNIDEATAEFITKHCDKTVIVFAEGALRGDSSSGVMKVNPEEIKVLAIPTPTSTEKSQKEIPSENITWPTPFSPPLAPVRQSTTPSPTTSTSGSVIDF